MFKRIEPKPGQESVWDYPRPPRLEPSTKHIQVIFNGITLADSTKTYRVLETSHPPGYYIPATDIKMEYLTLSPRQTFCEWKGVARYYTLLAEDRKIPNVGWNYPSPTERFAALKDCIAFYPSLLDACYVDGERVQAQEGDFYGGWITNDIVGPFKGGMGTLSW
ncbi:DUF427 domain-containing protein [Oscillatoria sp. FACHB-1406]|uniref:DUF427 domain-containing protein n=1 Tax=Oscillatoria sp. FACHB-1406 TaxID=2692846 RepID=UPI0016852A8A|nr:DUF427 domain-containing protein [Oscillatoria sp. FACHB-1406]